MQNTGKSGGTNESDHTHTRCNGEIFGSCDSGRDDRRVGDRNKVHTAGRVGLEVLYKNKISRSHEIVS